MGEGTRFRPFRQPKITLLIFLLVLLLLGGCARNLGVYSLSQYEGDWKPNIVIDPTFDPAGDFWDIMNANPDAPHADPAGSRRFRDGEVTINRVIPVPGADFYWDKFDMVFFYGHNNTIVPPHPHETFGYYNYEGGSWVAKSGYLDEIDWGHATNYDYYVRRPINDANLHPGAVTYLYNRYTSSLLGQGYDYGGGTQWQLHWNDPPQPISYGKLGDKRMEWLILYGCQAVITANMDGSYNPLAWKCFKAVRGKYLHIVMGHYHSYWCSEMRPLASFANDLIAEVPIQTAYFDTDPETNSSAISMEKLPLNMSTAYMVNDKWDKPSIVIPPDPDTISYIYYQRWIVPAGTTAETWN